MGIQVPNQFIADTLIRAEDINHNFNTLASCVVLSASLYNNFLDAVADATNKGVTLYVDSLQTILVDITITCTIIAPRLQIFPTNITVTFTPDTNTEIYPEWWGTNTTPGTTDMTNAFTNAVACIKASKVFVTDQGYTHTLTLSLGGTEYVVGPQTIDFHNFQIVGKGQRKTVLYPASGFTGVMFSLGVFSTSPVNLWTGTAQDSRFYGLTIWQQAPNLTGLIGSLGGVAIQDNGSGGTHLIDVEILGFHYGFAAPYGSDFSVFERCIIRNNDVGIFLGRGSQQISIRNTQFFLCGEGLVFEACANTKVDTCQFIDNKTSCITFEAFTSGNRFSVMTGGASTQELVTSIDNCWFETGAGYSTGWDTTQLILVNQDNSANNRHVEFRNMYISAGTSGMASHSGTSYCCVKYASGSALRWKFDNVMFAGGQFNYMLGFDGGSSSVELKNFKVQDGYSVASPVFFSPAALAAFQDTNVVMIDTYTSSEYTRNYSHDWVRRRLDRGNCIQYVDHSTDLSTWTQVYAYDYYTGKTTLPSGATITQSGSMPTTGTYTIGSIVHYNGSSTSQNGWRRITTGNTHLLNTDWVVF